MFAGFRLFNLLIFESKNKHRQAKHKQTTNHKQQTTKNRKQKKPMPP